jgi:hypothetical protein
MLEAELRPELEEVAAIYSNELATPDAPLSELDQPIWSVVSFERVEISNITYAAAMKHLQILEQKGVNGLCIVTAEAGKRVKTAG